MLPALVRKTWRDDRRAMIGWAVGVAAFTAIYTSFYASFQGAAQLKQDALPEGMLDFLGIQDMVSPAGYLQATIFSLIGPLLVLMCAVTLTARTIARPEEDGGMELLLVNPLSRRAFAVAAAAATGLRCHRARRHALASSAGIIVPGGRHGHPAVNVAAASAGLVALAWCFTGIAFSPARPPAAAGTPWPSPASWPSARTSPTPSPASSTACELAAVALAVPLLHRHRPTAHRMAPHRTRSSSSPSARSPPSSG